MAGILMVVTVPTCSTTGMPRRLPLLLPPRQEAPQKALVLQSTLAHGSRT
jgi:hypothetical protein